MSIRKVLIPALLLVAGAAARGEDAPPATAALFEVHDEIHDALAADAGIGELLDDDLPTLLGNDARKGRKEIP